MISERSELPPPLSTDTIRRMLGARVPKLVRGNDVQRYQALLDWDGLMEIVAGGDYSPKKLRLTRCGAPLSRALYQHIGKPKVPVIEQVMETGGSIVFYGIGEHAPAMGRLGAALSEAIGDHVVGSAIASTGDGGALPVHYDDTDLIVLQVEGGKRWFVEDEPVLNPVVGMQPVPRPAGARLLLDEVLQPGDFLFLPGGYRHWCETEGPRSLHLGFFFYPLTAPRALDLLKRQMIATAADRIPLRFEPDERQEVEERLKRMLIEKIDRLSLDELVTEHIRTEL